MDGGRERRHRSVISGPDTCYSIDRLSRLTEDRCPVVFVCSDDTGVRGGKYADVNNASALRDLSKMYISYVPGLQESAKEQEYV